MVLLFPASCEKSALSAKGSTFRCNAYFIGAKCDFYVKSTYPPIRVYPCCQGAFIAKLFSVCSVLKCEPMARQAAVNPQSSPTRFDAAAQSRASISTQFQTTCHQNQVRADPAHPRSARLHARRDSFHRSRRRTARRAFNEKLTPTVALSQRQLRLHQWLQTRPCRDRAALDFRQQFREVETHRLQLRLVKIIA